MKASTKINKFKIAISAILLAAFMSGCATKSSEIQAIYISPLQYSSYDCNQLRAELQRLQIRVTQVGGAFDERASQANLATAATVVLFWPAAFFVGGGNKEQQAELARLKGEQDAIQQTAIQLKCEGLVQSTLIKKE
jgi:hypothetical protein